MGKTTELDSGTLRRLVPSWLKEFPIGRTMLAKPTAHGGGKGRARAAARQSPRRAEERTSRSPRRG